ncbi:Dihydrolipoamide dehydrogenase [hydrothermal vent metagenome]|uniref:Dihydrolipoamide dehydrogenase n=1 Tax=hydrothermal vent metagenome TaxID=652676 RepID=A0A3B1CTL8_9ZZZZ
MSEKYDLAVLGGGPGGYVAAIRASQLGYKTVVVEKDKLGGVCLNWGCIPTKSLLKNAEVYDIVSNHSKDFGITVENVSFDFEKTIKRSRTVSKKIVKGVEYLFKKNKIDRVKGFGKLNSSKEIEVFDEDGNTTDIVKADRLIIATGARSKSIPAIPVDREKIITSSEAMNLSEQPKELIIIGAGVIGIEFAYFYATIGTKVTVIEMMDSILPIEDKEVSGALKKSLTKRGITFYNSAKVENVVVVGDIVEVVFEIDGKQEKITADKVLNAIGVTSNIEGIGLEELSIETENGNIQVDRSTFQTNVENIFAIGDVIGQPCLAHAASAEGIHCVETFHGEQLGEFDYSNIPGCTYSQPQVASIGFTEEKAIAEGYDIKVGKFPLSASGKAAAIGEREGFAKLIFDKKYGELLGAHLIGPEATELIAELTLAKTLEATEEAIARTVHAHPTLSEIIMEAAEDADGKSIHI